MKKITCFVLIALLVMGMSMNAVFADTNTDGNADQGEINLEKVIEMVNSANDSIQNEIESAQEKAAEYVGTDKEYLVAVIAASLIIKTEKIANDVVAKAAKLGIVVEKEYYEVQVGNITVWVDPCRVFNC